MAGQCFCGLLCSAAMVVFIVYMATYQRRDIRATVDSAVLSNLTVVSSTSTATVSYHLTVSLSFYNPNAHTSIYYASISAQLRFRDAVLGPAAGDTSPPAFHQRSRATDVVRLEFDGGSVGVAADVAAELEKEVKGEGRQQAAVSLELDLDLRVRYEHWRGKDRQKPWIWCMLSIPLPLVKAEGGVGGALGSAVGCGVGNMNWGW